MSNAAAGNINATTGVMTWANGFSGTVDIQVTANGCNGPSSQVVKTVTVNPNNLGVSSASATPTLCINTALVSSITHTTTNAIGIQNNGVSGANGLPAGVTATWSSNTITISGTPTANGVFNYSIPLIGGCGNVNATGTITVTLNSSVGAASYSPILCINTVLTTDITHTTSLATGIGTPANLPPGITASWSADTITISGTPTASGVYNYSIPVDGCGTVTATGTITVEDAVNPAGTIGGAIGNNIVCQGQTGVVYTVPAIANATGYVWSLPTGATITAGANTHSITVSYSTSATSGNITVYGTNSCGTGSVSTDFPVTVNTLSVAPTSISGTTTICQGNSTVLTVTDGSLGTNAIAEWFSGSCGGTSAGTGNSITVSPTTTTTYYVRYSGDCNATACASVTVTVDTIPATAGPITGTATVCQGDTGVTYTIPVIANATGYVWDLSAFSGEATITAGNNTNTITVNFSNTATSGNIAVYATNDCGDGAVSANYPVTVNIPSVVPTSISGMTTICEGTSTTLTLVGGTQGTGATAEWFSGSCGGTSAGTGNSITVSPTTTTTYYVRYSGSCNITTCASVTVTVDPLPVAAGAISGTATVCQGQTSVVYTVPAIANENGYVWTLPTGATITSGANTHSITVSFANNATSGNIAVYATNDCGDGAVSANYPVTVNIPSVMPTSITVGATPICEGTSTTLTLAGGTQGTGATAEWFSGSCGGTPAGTGNSITVSPTTTTTYFVRYSGDCNTTTCASVTVIVNPLPVAAGAISGLTPVCQGQTGVIYTVPAIANENGYVWTLPSGASGSSTTNSINVSFSNTATSGNITVYGTNSCGVGATATLAITVNISPYIPNSYTQTICSGDTATVTPANGGGNIVPAGTTYSWGLPTLSSVGVITGATAQTGQSSFSQTLTNTTNTQQTAVYNVTATTGGCSATVFIITVYVNPRPTVAVSPASPPNVETCSGATITLTPSNPNGISGGISYNWSRTTPAGVSGLVSGSGLISGSLTNSNSASTDVVYTITATSAAGCASISPATVTVRVHPTPTATISNPTQTICSESLATINLINPTVTGATTTYSISSGSNANVTGSLTPSGSSISGTLTNTTNTTQVTTFTVSAIANGCTNTIGTATITVTPKPTVLATLTTPASICSGDAVNINLTNPNGVAGTTYEWTSNNPGAGIANGSSGTGNIAGTLTNNGTANITVTFTIRAVAAGCNSNDTTVSITVRPRPQINVTNNNQSICHNTAMTAMNISTNLTGTTTYSWTRDNGDLTTGNIRGIAASGTGNLPTNISGTLTNHTTSTQTTTFTITATNANGCTNTTTASVTVYAPLVAPVIGYSQEVCGSFFGIGGGEAVPLYMITPVSGGSGNYSYQWQQSTNGTNGWTNVGTTATYTPTAEGYYRLIITDNNCSPSQSVTSNSDVRIRLTGASITSPNISGGSATPVCNGATIPTINVSIAHSFLSDVRFYWTVNNSYINPTSGGPVGTTVSTGWFTESTSHFFTNTFTANNHTNSTQTSIITITPRFTQGSNSCNSASATRTIEIRPIPRVASISSPSTTICSGSTTNINVVGNITDAPMSFAWQIVGSLPAGVTASSTSGTSGSISNIPSPGTFNLGVTLTNTGTSTQSVTFRITPSSLYSSVNCTGVTQDIIIQVAPTVLGTVSSDQTICSGGTPAQLTLSSVTGVSISHQWQSSTDGTNFSPITPSQTGTTYTPPTLTQSTWYRVLLTSTPVGGVTCTAYTNSVKITVNSITSAGTIANSQTVCLPNPAIALTGTAATIPAANASATITYQWESSTTAGCNSGFTTVTTDNAANLNYTIPAGSITQTTYFRRKTTSTLNGVSCLAYSNCITITPNSVAGGNVSANQIICQGATPASLNLSGATAGASLQWESSTNTTDCVNGTWTTIPGATLATYTPSALTVTTYYRVSVTSTVNGVSCSTYSNCVTITVNPAVDPGSINSNQTVCHGGNPAAFTGSAVSGATHYQWQISTDNTNFTDIFGATAEGYDAPGPINQITYYRRIAFATQNGIVCQSNPTSSVTVFVNQIVGTPTITGTQSACSIATVMALTVTAHPTGTGTRTYYWQSSTTGCAGTWTDVTPAATGNSYTPTGAFTATTHYRIRVSSTLNGVTCTDVFSNCIEVTYTGKTWNGLVSDNWNEPNNWTPIGVPNNTHCVVIPNVTIDPIIQGTNYDAFAYNLSVLAGGKLEVNSTNNITVTDFVNVNATGLFDIKNNASLVQINDSAINVGNIKYTRVTRSMTRYAYVYWGSPVEQSVLSQIPSQFDQKYRWEPNTGAPDGTWLPLTTTTRGEGFITRVKNIAPFNTGTGTITFPFTGKPNNGIVNINVNSYDSSSLVTANTTLLANPYPSIIDAEEFLTHPNNTELGGTLSFWTSVTLYSGSGPYNTQDYASWNLTGGTVTAKPPITDPSESLRPTGKIAAGQGFFAQVFADGQISFNNDMRESGNNSQFYRTNTNEKHRIWLNLYDQTKFRQTLVGYIDGATNDFDRLYDGDSFTSNEINIYSLINNRALVIQGKALPFEDTDIIPLGYKITSAGSYNISIDELDGIFAGNQNIYLKDNLLNTIHDIKASHYTFVTGSGTFNDRFELVFQANALGIDNPTSTVAQAYIKDETLYINATKNIQEIILFDIAGKKLTTFVNDIPVNSFKTEFNYPNGVYIAKIIMDDNSIVNVKIGN
ncbi:Ig-like domain-containing protein [Flavobacterium solisilvae]|uniref:Ig-like domain-containing protein n=1 Tax=Flavobacterium solisilvae TaxID=1852019 RepID=UPI001B7D1EDC|nr:PKD-like domain-containing protein [Flavobacterium solisilvae]